MTDIIAFSIDLGWPNSRHIDSFFATVDDRTISLLAKLG